MQNFIELSLRENRFWLEIMEEHAIFMRMGFPCDATQLIEKAKEFEKKFSELLDMVKNLQNPTVSKVKEINAMSIELTESFIQFKTHVLDLLINCKLGGFNFPLLIVHIRREAMRFVQILKQLNIMSQPGRRELTESVIMDEIFWTLTMEEHAKFISHLLDPSMESLIHTANSFAAIFDKLNKEARRIEERVNGEGTGRIIRFSRELIKPVTNIRNFKAEAERLIENCEILALIPPLLADHVKREAEKFLQDIDDHIMDLELVKGQMSRQRRG